MSVLSFQFFCALEILFAILHGNINFHFFSSAVFQQPKCFHVSQWSLQSSQPKKYISVPDENGIQRSVPVDDQQLQDMCAILNRQQTATVPTTFQAPLLGSLPSATSAQSVFSTHSSQSSLGNVSAGR